MQVFCSGEWWNSAIQKVGCFIENLSINNLLTLFLRCDTPKPKKAGKSWVSVSQLPTPTMWSKKSSGWTAFFGFGVMHHHFNGGTLSHGSLTSGHIAITSFLRVTGCPLFAAAPCENIQSRVRIHQHMGGLFFLLWNTKRTLPAYPRYVLPALQFPL